MCVCHQISEQPRFVPGVWGPYLSPMVPDMWLNEGGQSATGRLVSPLKAARREENKQRQILISPETHIWMYSHSMTQLRCDL